MKNIQKLVNLLFKHSGAYKATIFVDDKNVVVATRRRYGGRILKTGNQEILIRIGRPNYEERELIKKAKKTKTFPITGIQLKCVKC